MFSTIEWIITFLIGFVALIIIKLLWKIIDEKMVTPVANFLGKIWRYLTNYILKINLLWIQIYDYNLCSFKKEVKSLNLLYECLKNELKPYTIHKRGISQTMLRIEIQPILLTLDITIEDELDPLYFASFDQVVYNGKKVLIETISPITLGRRNLGKLGDYLNIIERITNVISRLFFDEKLPKQMFFIAKIYQKNKKEYKVRDVKNKATIYVRSDYIQISGTESTLLEKIVKKYT